MELGCRQKEGQRENQTQHEEGLEAMTGGGEQGRVFLVLFSVVFVLLLKQSLTLLPRLLLNSCAYVILLLPVSRGAGMIGSNYYVWL